MEKEDWKNDDLEYFLEFKSEGLNQLAKKLFDSVICSHLEKKTSKLQWLPYR